MIKSILLPIDLNHISSWEKAMPQVINIAQNHDAEVHVLAVIPETNLKLIGQQIPHGFVETAMNKTKTVLDDLVAREFPENVPVTTHISHGVIYKEIIFMANQTGSDTIVMGANRTEMKSFLIGPNSDYVVRHAKRSVFIVR